MIVKRGRGDLNNIYRPCKIDEVIGNDTIKRIFNNALSNGTLPHSMLFTGPSGCGKTTFARIVAMGLNCKEGPTGNPCCKCDSCVSILNENSFAVLELDAARTSDVGTIRQVLEDLPAASMGGERYKVAIFDEAHNLSGKAEDALLKFLEDTPEHVYVILCTNLASKLKEVTRNRLKTTQFGRLTDDDIISLLKMVCEFEGFAYVFEILKFIAEESNGVPRASLSFLQMVASEGSWTKEAASLVVNAGVSIDHAEVFEFCKYLLKGHGFKECMNMYKKLKNIPAETMRINICGFFVGCLKNARTLTDAMKFSKIVDLFSIPVYSNPKPDHVLVNNLFKATQILGGK